MSEAENNQLNKAHNKKKDKYKKKHSKKSKFDSENLEDQPTNENEQPKAETTDKTEYEKAKLKNPKAFALNSFVAAERQFRRTQDIKEKRSKVPEVDRSALEPPPIVVAIVGPPSVGKSTLMQNLIKNYTRTKLNNIKGPVTVVTNKNRRLTIIECNNDLNSMIDVAKVADLVLLMIDASFGFEMETFEFLNICQVHGFPRIMGILTHMDLLTNSKQLKKTKKKLKHRFWTEIYQGAKLFYLTGIVNGEYRKHEIHNLARFISVMKFKDLGYRANHSFIIADRIEDITQPDLIRQNEKCDRNVCFYGYVRGCPLKKNANIHIPGNGDYQIADISFLSDPCPLPSKEKKRTLDDRERLLYAPFSGVGGLVYDKDAVYIELGGSHSYNVVGGRPNSENKRFFENIISSKKTIDSKLLESKMKLFTASDENQTILDDVKQSGDEEPKEETRIRKKVTFFDGASDNEDDDEEDNEEEESEPEPNSDQEDDDDDIEEQEDDGTNLKWRENIKLNAKLNFEKNRNVNWNSLVYGKERQSLDQEETNGANTPADDFFTLKKTKKEGKKEDNTKYETELKEFHADKASEEFESIKDCFVTGKWEKDKDAQHLLDEDDDEFGDFVDLEQMGHKDDEINESDFDDDDEELDDEEDEDEEDDENKEPDGEPFKRKKTRNELTKRERLIAKKKRLKVKFNKEFDSNKMLDKDGIPQDSYYDALAQEADKQTDLNRLEFEKMDDQTRIEYEGFKCGLYVRCEIKNIPAEFVQNFNAKYLAILGSLVTNESNIGCVTVRLKKHRWYNKILKTKNPLIISLGWRRFQTIPLYYIQDHNMRNRYLKYTPQHMYCHAAFWGPITAPNTGFIAFESLSNGTKHFRAAATGVVVDMNKSVQIVKKLKLIGQPLKIFRKTAFLTGMFSSVLEASKFEGASIKTVSGIRGQIKKALHASSVPAGSVRATFEDKILASDTIFLRSWFAVSIPKFYTPVTNLLTNNDDKEIVSVKALSALKKEKELQIVPNVNSLYKPIEREEKVMKPFKVNRHIEEQLPFKFKNKTDANKIDLIEKQRVAIIREPHEEKIAAAMNMLKKVYKHRMDKKDKDHSERVRKHKVDADKLAVKRLQKSKVVKKQIYRRLGKQEKRNNKSMDD